MKAKTKERNITPAHSKVSITKVPGLTQPELTVHCKAHKQLMHRVGRSERGLPLYFCEDGCVAEVGVGRVKRFLEEKKFGFIYKRGEDMFFHWSSLVGVDSVNRGTLVVYWIGYNRRKGRLQAVEVKPLNGLRGEY
ncbi:MAG: cold shock domain-containing protein [Candidatus Bipolaricaulota bacterium]|nr:cold shock domain-containing protein [Candidatus Bipolaricaulota bacterium]